MGFLHETNETTELTPGSFRDSFDFSIFHDINKYIHFTILHYILYIIHNIIINTFHFIDTLYGTVQYSTVRYKVYNIYIYVVRYKYINTNAYIYIDDRYKHYIKQ